MVSVSGPRKHQHLATHRRLEYAGFHLDTVTEEIEGAIPAQFLDAARDALVESLLGGESAHPDQGRIRRAVSELDEFWRRSGGGIESASPASVRGILRAQVESVRAGKASSASGSSSRRSRWCRRRRGRHSRSCRLPCTCTEMPRRSTTKSRMVPGSCAFTCAKARRAGSRIATCPHSTDRCGSPSSGRGRPPPSVTPSRRRCARSGDTMTKGRIAGTRDTDRVPGGTRGRGPNAGGRGKPRHGRDSRHWRKRR